MISKYSVFPRAGAAGVASHPVDRRAGSRDRGGEAGPHRRRQDGGGSARQDGQDCDERARPPDVTAEHRDSGEHGSVRSGAASGQPPRLRQLHGTHVIVLTS